MFFSATAYSWSALAASTAELACCRHHRFRSARSLVWAAASAAIDDEAGEVALVEVLHVRLDRAQIL